MVLLKRAKSDSAKKKKSACAHLCIKSQHLVVQFPKNVANSELAISMRNYVTCTVLYANHQLLPIMGTIYILEYSQRVTDDV